MEFTLEEVQTFKRALQSRINSCQYMATKAGTNGGDMEKHLKEITYLIPLLAKVEERLMAQVI